MLELNSKLQDVVHIRFFFYHVYIYLLKVEYKNNMSYPVWIKSSQEFLSFISFLEKKIESSEYELLSE